jgi:MFS family permease
VSFLVVDFDPDLTRDEAGLYAGLVAGGCFFGNFLSSYFWGYLSDRYGRKRLLISGTVGTLVSVILVGIVCSCYFFLALPRLGTGFSSSIWWAIAARSFSGIMNGNLGIAKSLIGEISTSKTLAQSFGCTVFYLY